MYILGSKYYYNHFLETPVLFSCALFLRLKSAGLLYTGHRIKGCIVLVHGVRVSITEYAVMCIRAFITKKKSCLKKKQNINFDY